MPASEGLVRGGYYHFVGRNIYGGVFAGGRVLLGLRDKFGLRLDSEYLADGGEFGTVFRVGPLREMLPADIPVQLTLGTVDWKSMRPMRYVEAPQDAPLPATGHWEFSDTGERATVGGEDGARPAGMWNKALFDWLKVRNPTCEEARRSCGMAW